MREEKGAIRQVVINIKTYKASVNEEGEILLNGILHDVKKVRHEGELVHLQVVEDKKETRLMKTFADFSESLHKQDRSQKCPQQIWNWLFKIYPCTSDGGFELQALLPAAIRFGDPNNHITSFALTSPGQPPELFS
jgi:hypothetical protein